jgi:inner membrane protein
MNTLTHAVLGLALSEALMLNPLVVVLGALIPDIDYLIGLTHRTLTHSWLFMIPSCLLVWKIKHKRTALALLIGLSSHLILDAVTQKGIPLFYPHPTYYSFNLTRSADVMANLFIILLSVIILLNKESIHDYLFSLKKGIALKTVIGSSASFFLILALFPVIDCPPTKSISQIMALPSETSVSVIGEVCSTIDLRTSQSGNEYQVFTLCDESGNITVWKGAWVLENNLSKGNVIQLCGTYTSKFSQPEIYYINKVKHEV